MPRLNENFQKMAESYLFSEINHRVDAYSKKNPDKKIIRLGIGDVTLPLAPVVIDALHRGVDDMASAETFKGYGPEQGYDFLRKAISDHYGRKGVEIDTDDIFISDGAKCDTGNLTDMFGSGNVILIPDPVYPVYVDSNLMRGNEVTYIDATAENDFLPMPDRSVHADIIYICSPNNPTGAAYNNGQLKQWVDYAIENEAVIIFDAAYEAFIGEPGIPHSIYSVDGAERCAIECGSLSKTAGFTGARCGYTIVPKELTFKASDGSELSLRSMWLRRQTTKFNGASYIIQKGAEAAFSEEGMAQCMENINYYKENARIIANKLSELNINYFGGVNSPYIWLECPDDMGSWDFFDLMLDRIQVVGTPGAGFGRNGESYFRLTSFGSRENTEEAMQRFGNLLEK